MFNGVIRKSTVDVLGTIPDNVNPTIINLTDVNQTSSGEVEVHEDEGNGLSLNLGAFYTFVFLIYAQSMQLQQLRNKLRASLNIEYAHFYLFHRTSPREKYLLCLRKIWFPIFDNFLAYVL